MDKAQKLALSSESSNDLISRVVIDDNTNIFLVNCTWADWGNFTQCTESCGGGFKTRSRVIASPPLYGGAACEGDAFESVVCNEQPCPSM